MDVRVGVMQAKELEIDMPDDTDRDKLAKEVESVLDDEDKVLWLTDRRGRRVGVPSKKIAYVEIGGPGEERRVGFGA